MNWPKCQSSDFGDHRRHKWEEQEDGTYVCERCEKKRNPEALPIPKPLFKLLLESR